MKAFTSLMKISITVVSLALTVMLVVSAAPLVMGGVNVENTTPVEIGSSGTDVTITGEYTVTSKLTQDISDLMIKAYLVSRDATVTKDLVQVGPVTINPDNPEVKITLNQRIPAAELAIFYVSDNMGSGETGLSLPVTIEVKGSYSNNLAGVNMKMVFKIPLSETGSINVDPSAKKVTGDGEISQAAVSVNGIDPGLSGLIPAGGAEFQATIDGVGIGFQITKDGSGNLELTLNSTDVDNLSIMEGVNTLLDSIKNADGKTINFEFNGESHSFDTSDVDSETVKQYSEQIEGICESLEMFLKAYDKMTGGA